MIKGRRRFLKWATTAASAAAVPPAFSQVIRDALAVPAARSTGTIQDVQHVVILMQENRAFDHYFGCLRGVRGYGDPRPLQLRSGKPVWYQPDVTTGNWVLPFHLDGEHTSAQFMKYLNHNWKGSHEIWKNHEAWIQQKTVMTMGHFTRADLPFYYALADAFTVCDGYHASLFGPTNPNRMFMFSGSSGISAGHPGPQAVNNIDDHNWLSDMARDNAEFPGFAWTTYAERLQQAGIDWKVYQEYDNYGDNALQFFANFRKLDTDSPLYQRARTWVDGSTVENAAKSQGEHLVAAFERDVASGKLPQVSWLVAPFALCEHPESPPGYGESLSARLLEVLARHPEVWSKTVFLINYDENDGFFDHVPPPLPAIRPELGGSTVATADEDYEGVPVGLGLRVPMLVVSPWSRGGWVNSQVFDHTSVLRFLEARFGVIEPNISQWRRTVTGDLTSTLDFSGANPTWPSLPDTGDYLSRTAATRHLPPPAVPTQQSVPQQEPGQRPARALPYDFDAESSLDENGVLRLDIVNRGTVGVALNIYPAEGEAGPWFYTVGAGLHLAGEWNVPSRGEHGYDLSLHGPNGFLRSYAGDLSGPKALRINARLRYEPQNDRLTLTLHNEGDTATVMHIRADTYGHKGPSKVTVPARGEASTHWNISSSAHWYDFVIESPSHPGFSRRLAGHIETGKPSLSDPAIAQAQPIEKAAHHA